MWWCINACKQTALLLSTPPSCPRAWRWEITVVRTPFITQKGADITVKTTVLNLLCSPISFLKNLIKQKMRIVLQTLLLFSVVQSSLILWASMDCSMPGFPVLYHLPELAQTHVHWVSDAIQPSHSLLSPSPPAFNLSQHQSLFQWVSSSHQEVKVLEIQLQHQYFQWIFRTDLL